MQEPSTTGTPKWGVPAQGNDPDAEDAPPSAAPKTWQGVGEYQVWPILLRLLRSSVITSQAWTAVRHAIDHSPSAGSCQLPGIAHIAAIAAFSVITSQTWTAVRHAIDHSPSAGRCRLTGMAQRCCDRSYLGQHYSKPDRSPPCIRMMDHSPSLGWQRLSGLAHVAVIDLTSVMISQSQTACNGLVDQRRSSPHQSMQYRRRVVSLSSRTACLCRKSTGRR